MFSYSNGTNSGSQEFLNVNITDGSSNKSNVVEFHPDLEYILDRNYVRVIFFILYSLVFGVCFFGNLAVVLAVTLHWKLRNRTKFCLGNLAFANLCVAIFCVYQNFSTYITQSWVFGKFLCKMYHFINSLSQTASILILVVICIERYLAILHPFTCRAFLTMTRLRIIIVMVWLVSALISSPRLYYITTFEVPNETSPICSPQLDIFNTAAFDTIYFILLFILPMSAMSFLYTRVGLFLWRSSEILQTMIPPLSSLSFNELQSESSSSILNTSSALSGECASPIKQCYRKSAKSLKRLTRRCQWQNQGCSSTFSSRFTSTDESIQLGRTNVCAQEREGNLNFSARSSQVLKSAKKTSKLRKAFNCTRREERKPTLRSVLNARSRRRRCKLDFYPCTKQCSNGICGRILNSPRRSPQVPTSIISYPPNYAYRPTSSVEISRPKSRRCVSNISSFGRRKLLKPRQAAVKVLILIVATFALCNLPFHIRKILQNFLPGYEFDSTFSYIFTPVTHLLMYANCAINPILYAFMSKGFRASLRDLIHCRFKRTVHRCHDSMTV